MTNSHAYLYNNSSCLLHTWLFTSTDTWQESSCGFGCRGPLAAFSLNKQSNSLPVWNLKTVCVLLLFFGPSESWNSCGMLQIPLQWRDPTKGLWGMEGWVVVLHEGMEPHNTGWVSLQVSNATGGNYLSGHKIAALVTINIYSMF